MVKLLTHFMIGLGDISPFFVVMLTSATKACDLENAGPVQ
jgi:hypothetical protein